MFSFFFSGGVKNTLKTRRRYLIKEGGRKERKGEGEGKERKKELKGKLDMAY